VTVEALAAHSCALCWKPDWAVPRVAPVWYDLNRRIKAAGKSVQAIEVPIDEAEPLIGAVGRPHDSDHRSHRIRRPAAVGPRGMAGLTLDGRQNRETAKPRMNTNNGKVPSP